MLQAWWPTAVVCSPKLLEATDHLVSIRMSLHTVPFEFIYLAPVVNTADREAKKRKTHGCLNSYQVYLGEDSFPPTPEEQ